MKIAVNRFTIDSSSIFTVENGHIKKEPRHGSLVDYANTGDNVGYIDPNKPSALRIRFDDICRINLDAFMELRKQGKISPTDVTGVIQIEYDADVFTDLILGVDTQYKFNDKKALADDDPCDENGIPKSVQELARSLMKRNITVPEIELYKKIVDAIDNNNGEFQVQFTDQQNAAWVKLLNENVVSWNNFTGTPVISVIDNDILGFMRRAVALYVAFGGSLTEEVDSFGIPVLAQEMAVKEVGHKLRPHTIETYRLIVNAVKGTGRLNMLTLTPDKEAVLESMQDANIVVVADGNVSVPDAAKLSYMCKVVDLYDKCNKSEPVISNEVEDEIPDLVQDLAKQFIGREVTIMEIRVYKRICEAVEHYDLGHMAKGATSYPFDANALNSEERRTFDRICNEFIVYSTVSGIRMISMEDRILHFIKRAVELFEGSKIVNSGKKPDGATIAASAMNLSKEERERIGLVNQGIPERPSEEGTNRRFGGGGNITVGSIHRPAVCPITKPVIQEDTSAWYAAKVMKYKFIKFQKPIGVRSKVCVDKRFPMYSVPMIVDDMLGYAYLKEFPEKVVNVISVEYIPISTPVEGTYWTFYNMENNKGITFYPDVLVDVISNNTSIFPDIDLTGKIRIAVNNFGNLFSDDVEESKKAAIMNIYSDFFRRCPNLFHVMKIDWNTGFVIALSEESTPVLLMAAMLGDGYVEYPKYMTVIPISGSVGFAAVGLSASEVSNIETALGILGQPLE